MTTCPTPPSSRYVPLTIYTPSSPCEPLNTASIPRQHTLTNPLPPSALPPFPSLVQPRAADDNDLLLSADLIGRTLRMLEACSNNRNNKEPLAPSSSSSSSSASSSSSLTDVKPNVHASVAAATTGTTDTLSTTPPHTLTLSSFSHTISSLHFTITPSQTLP